MSAFETANRQIVIHACLVAAVVSGVLFAAFTLATDHSGLQGLGYGVLLLLVGIISSLAAILILALPVFLILTRLRAANLWSALVAGFLIGAAMAGATEWPQSGISALTQGNWTDHAVRRIYAHAAIGAISASCFWLILSYRTRQVKRN